MRLHTLALIVGLAPIANAHAEKPPVEVEIIVDGDQDFFGAKKKKGDTEKRSDELFKELEKEERVRAKSSGGDNVNTNTQVVKVIVIGGEQKTEAEATPKVDTRASAKSVPPPPPPTPRVAPPPPPPRRMARRHRRPRAERRAAPEAPRRRSWWSRDPRPGAGDFMLSLAASTWERGGMGGLGGEILITDVLGLRVEGYVAGFDRDDLEDSEDHEFLSDAWAREGRDLSSVQGGTVHRLGAQVAFHIIPGKAFDLAPAIGVTHFGYALDTGKKEAEVGGAGFLTASLGAAYHIKRIFFGVDLGWHPYRMFSYSDSPRVAGDTLIDEGKADSTPTSDPFDPTRFTFTGKVGMRF